MVANYCEKRIAALTGEIEQIDTAVLRLQQQLTTLTQRRLLLQGALLELQDIQRQQNGERAGELEAAFREES